jgi:GNAT superfamily N-acetyltransferase
MPIRPASPADAPTLVALIRELADFEHLTHLVKVTPEQLAQQLFGSRPAAECVVVEQGGEVIAFALFFHNFSTFLGQPGLYLEDLYVRPAHRGRGVGRSLLVHLAGLAHERGCGRFEWSVLDWNANAIAFYEKLGATVMPDWRICRVTGSGLQALATSAGSST